MNTIGTVPPETTSGVRRRILWGLVALVVLYAVVDTALLLSPMFIPVLRFHGAHYNWGGKIMSITFACILLAWSLWLRQNVGLRLQQSPGSFRLSFMCFFACIAAGVVTELPIRAEAFSLEVLLFQAFVPACS